MKSFYIVRYLLLAGIFGLIGIKSWGQAFTTNNIAVLVATASTSNTTGSIVELNNSAANQTAITTHVIDGVTPAIAMRFSGSATSTMYLANSNDGSLLCFTGANNTTAGATNVNTLNPRGVGTYNNAGTFTLQTTYTGTSGNQTRGTSSLNNTTWYVGDQGGFYSNGTSVASPTGNIRSVKAFGGTVYAFTASTTAAPVGIISAPSGGTYTALAGLPIGTASYQDFYLVSSGSNGTSYDVLYILSATSATAGTIAKYSLVAGSWTANGSYATTFGGFGMAAQKQGTGAYLFVSSGTGATINNNVIRVTDLAGYNTTINVNTGTNPNITLYTATGSAIIKGVAFTPAIPTIIPTPSSLTAFTYVQGSGPSSSQPFTISASYLTAGGGTITFSGSTDYEVSSDNTTFGPIASLTYTGTGTLGSNTIYVRLKAGLSTNTYNSETIGINGGGATSSVTVSGNVTAAPIPSITPTPSSLTGFNYLQGSGPSTSQSFSLVTSNLTAGGGTITIGGSADYEVSSDNTTFGATATLPYTGTGALASNTVYVRLKAGLSAGTYSSETIGISGGGGSTSVTVSGSVSPLPYYYWNGPTTTGTGPSTGGTGTWNTTTTNWIYPNDNATGTSTAWTSSAANFAFFNGTGGTVTLGISPTFAQANFNSTGYMLLAPAGTTTLSGPVVLASNVNLQVPVDNTTTTGPTLAFTGNISGGANSSLTIRSNATVAGTTSRLNLTTSGETISVPVTITAGAVANNPIAGIVGTSTLTAITSNISNSTGVTGGVWTMLGATSGNSLTFSGVLSGASNLQFSAGPSGGAGVVTMGNNSTYTGATYFNAANSGIIKLGVTNALPTATDVYMAVSTSNGGILDLNGFSQTIGNLESTGVGGGSITNSGAANSTLTITQTNATAQTFALPITDGSTNKIIVIKNGTGNLILSGTNTYTGSTTINAGTITLGKASALAATGAVVLNGGTFSSGTAAGFSNTLGTLTLTDNSTIALGTGVHSINFANSSAASWTAGKTLTITGWQGAYNGTSGTAGKIFAGSDATGLTVSQLLQIQFFNGTSNYPATILSTGEVVPIAPTIVPTPSTLSGFTYVVGSGPSASQSFTLSASNLAAGGGTINISGSADYEVSTDNTTFGATATLTYTGTGTLASNTVYVRLKAGLPIGTYNSETINISGGTATATVTVSGNVTGLAIITPSPASLSGFTYVQGAGPSASQSFTITGINLVPGTGGTITISGSADYEVSTDNTTFGATATLPYTGSGTISPNIVYVRLKVLVSAGTYNETIGISGGNATSSVAVSGTVTALSNYYWNGPTITGNGPSTGGTGTWNVTPANTNWIYGSDDASGTSKAWTNSATNFAFFNGTAGTVTPGSTPLTFGQANFNTTGYILLTSAATTLAGNVVLAANVALQVPVDNTTVPSATLSFSGNISGAATSSLIIRTNATTAANYSRINLSSAGATISVPVTITAAATTGGNPLAGIVGTAVGTAITSNIINNTGTGTTGTARTLLGSTSGFSLNFSGVLSGASNLQFSAGPSGGAGVVTMGNNSTYTGATYFNAANSGIIKLGVTNALPTATDVYMAVSTSNGGILDLNGFSQTIGNLESTGVGGGSITNSGAANSTLTITQTNATAQTFALPITDGSTNKIIVIKNGTGNLILSGTNTYTGSTTINAGTITLGKASALAATGAVVLNGGTFSSGTAAGFSNTLGTLTLTDNSTIALGTGVHSINFANSSAASWTAGKTLTITGWQGAYNGTSGTAGKIFAGSDATGLTVSQLLQIQFFNGTSNYPATILSTGEVVPIAPTIVPTPSTLSGFTYVVGSGPSASQSFTLSASNLAAGGGTINISGSADYEVSTDNTTFGATATLTYTGTGTLASNTVYVRLKAGLPIGTYNSETINISGGTATATVTVSGNVTGLAIITPSPASLSGFTYVQGAGPSASQSFTITGINLVPGTGGTITISGSADYEVSTDNTTFGATATLPYTGSGTISPNIVYVRLKVLVSAGTYNETIGISGGNATSSVAVSGTVTALSNYYWNGPTITGNGPSTGGTGTWNVTPANTNWIYGSDDASGTSKAWTNSATNFAFFNGTAGTVTPGSTPLTFGQANFNTTGYILLTSAATTLAGNVVLAANVALQVPVDNTTVPSATLSFSGNISGAATSSLIIRTNATTAANYSRINLSSAGATISVPVTITAAATTGGNPLAGIVGTAVGTAITSNIINNTGTGTTGTARTLLGSTSGFSLNFSGVLSGASNLQFSAGPSGGAGVVTMGNNSTYTGATYFNAANSGIIKLGVTNALPTATDVYMAVSTSNGGILDLNGFSQTIGNLESTGVGGGSITNSGAANSTLTITQTNATAQTFALPITDGSTNKIIVIKNGTGNLILSGTNTYTGGTTITQGILTLGKGNILADLGAIILNGGTFSSGLTTGFNETVGTLSLTDNSTIALGTGVHSINFANSSAASWTAGKTLTITGWQGAYNGTSGTAGKIFAGSDATGLTVSQLLQIQFFNGTSNYPATILSTGEVVPIAPTIVPTPSTLSGFTYVVGSGPSASQSFTLSASNLAAGGGTINISGSADYEVSTDNTTFGATATLTYTGTGTLASNTVYVRLKAGLPIGTYNSETINISGGTATASVTVSGNVTGVATITPSPTSLSGFTYAQGYGPSASQSFTISASNLTAGGGTITVTGSTDYEVSTDNTTFGATATLAYIGTGTLASNIVYVRLKAGLTVGSYNNETIGISGGGATSSVLVSGNVTTPAITLSDNGTPVGPGSMPINSTNNILSSFIITNNSAGSLMLTQINVPLAGNYKSADITDFKLYEATTNNFGAAVQLGTSQTSTSSGGGETITFGSLGQSVAATTSYYYWIITDVSSVPTIGDSVLALGNPQTNFTFSGSPTILGSVSKAGAQTITTSSVAPGLLAVLSTGDGSTTLSSSASIVKVYQFNTSTANQTGTLLRILPTTPTNGNTNRAVTQSGSATSEGALNLSANARYLTLVGYNASPGTASVATGTADAAIARIDANLNTNTITSFNRTNAYTANNIRSSVTVDGTSYWTSGPAANGGVRYITNGSSSGTGIQINVLNSRVLNIFNGQLYNSSQSGTNIGVNTVGVGLPTTAAAVTLLNNVNTANAYSYVFLNSDPTSPTPNLLYVTGNSSTLAQNGIFKYYYNGTNWIAEGQALSGSAAFGITGTVDASGNVVLYVTDTSAVNAKPSQLVKYSDNSIPSATISLSGAVVLAKAGVKNAFGGVSFTPLVNGDTTVTTAGVALNGLYRNITVASGGSVTLSGNLQVLGNVSVLSGGTLDCGVYTITTYSPDFRTYFSVASGATLITANPAGISATGATGSVQTSVFNNGTTSLTCIRNYSAGANYLYNGTTAQQTGTGLPTSLTGNLTVNNASGVTLNSTAQTVNGTLSLISGAFIFPANSTDTLGGLVTHTGGSLAVNNTSGIVLNGTTLKALYFTPGNNYIKNVTVSTGANNVSLDDSLYITAGSAFGTLISNGTLNTNNYLTLKSDINGTARVATSAGNINGDVTVERYIATGPGPTPNHLKSWQLLSVPTSGPGYTDGQSIKAAWQEGATAITGPGPYPNAANPTPGYGVMLTSDVANATNQPTPGYDAYTPLPNGPSIKVYNSLSGGYDSIPSTSLPVFDKRGYFVFVRGDRSVYTFGGTAVSTILRTSGRLFTIAHAPQTTSIPVNAFGSIGNPYASAIDMRTITLSGGVSPTYFYVWDPRLAGNFNYGGFVTFQLNAGNYSIQAPAVSPTYGSAGTINNYIQSGQAFFMETSGSAGTVGFNEASKAVGTGTSIFSRQYSDDNASTLRITLQSGTDNNSVGKVIDGTLNQFDDAYNNEIDSADARKMTNTGENISIKSNNVLLAIERKHPIAENDTIFLNLTGERVQAYQFSIDAKNLNTVAAGYVEDTYTKTSTPLKLRGNTIVNFSVENIAGSYAPDRFRIIFSPLRILPVTFASIKAYKKDKNIDVQWQVSNENNIKQYEVEKAADGMNFTTLTTAKPTNNKGGSAVYTTEDIKPIEGYNYYRVKSTDLNGANSYSTIVHVIAGTIKQDININPNPITDGEIHLQFMNEAAGKYGIRLLNNLGQVIVSKEITRQDGTNTELIKWDFRLARGLYKLEVTKPDGSVKNINVLF